MLRQLLTAAAFLLYSSASIQASVVTNGSLLLNIHDGNGAIDAVVFGGADFYNPGSSVSNFGMQVSTSTSTFRLNDTNGGEGINVTSVANVAGTITATGQYAASGATIDVTRKYSLVSGENAFKIVTTLTNLAGPIAGLRLFDTADPDQSGFSTSNDRKTLGGGTVLQAVGASGLTTIWGFANPGGFSGGFGLGIFDGVALNNFFGTGGDDPNGALNDIGMALGFQTDLGVGQSVSYTYYQAYGTSIAAAEAAFLAAVASSVEPGAVPEPTMFVIWSVLAMAGVRRWREEHPDGQV